jgi:hypothetical protein
MDIEFSLNTIGFTVSDNTESKDLLYWYSSYQKDKENLENEKKRIKNKTVIRRKGRPIAL